MQDKMKYSLLDDSLIEVRFKGQEKEYTNLPHIFSELMENNIISFEALQPHQQQPWYSFLVQLAAMAVSRENNGDIPSSIEKWRQMLIGLADGSKAAWHLVVEDVSKPAFMQTPIPEGSLEEAGYKSDIETPDELDMLVTSKNHDIKGNRILNPEPQHWLYALLTLQTMEGYSGKFNYGIARMNGGGGNRPLIGFSEKLSWGGRFRRDLEILLSNRNKLADDFDFSGYSLLWLLEWDGTKKDSLQLSVCDPFFLEICRRIRFRKTEKGVKCFKKSTKSKRIEVPDELNGITNDPWTPIDKGEAKILTITESGFTYKLLQELLIGEKYQKPFAMKFQADERDRVFMINQALVRGGGIKTETNGLHKRIIPIPPKVHKLLMNDIKKDKFAERANNRVALALEVQKQILYPSVRELIREGLKKEVTRKQTIKENKQINPWLKRFDQEIDRRFFESLWASVEMDQEEATRQWEEILLEEAKKQFKQAERSTPIAQLRRLRAVSKARSIFYGQVHKILEFAGKETTSAN